MITLALLRNAIAAAESLKADGCDFYEDAATIMVMRAVLEEILDRADRGEEYRTLFGGAEDRSKEPRVAYVRIQLGASIRVTPIE